MRGKEDGITERKRWDKPSGRCKSCMGEAAVRRGEVRSEKTFCVCVYLFV